MAKKNDANNSELIKELQQYNKNLDSLLPESIAFKYLNQDLKSKQNNETLLASNIIDLRTEINLLRKHLLDDVDAIAQQTFEQQKNQLSVFLQDLHASLLLNNKEHLSWQNKEIASELHTNKQEINRIHTKISNIETQIKQTQNILNSFIKTLPNILHETTHSLANMQQKHYSSIIHAIDAEHHESNTQELQQLQLSIDTLSQNLLPATQELQQTLNSSRGQLKDVVMLLENLKQQNKLNKEDLEILNATIKTIPKNTITSHELDDVKTELEQLLKTQSQLTAKDTKKLLMQLDALEHKPFDLPSSIATKKDLLTLENKIKAIQNQGISTRNFTILEEKIEDIIKKSKLKEHNFTPLLNTIDTHKEQIIHIHTIKTTIQQELKNMQEAMQNTNKSQIHKLLQDQETHIVEQLESISQTLERQLKAKAPTKKTIKKHTTKAIEHVKKHIKTKKSQLPPNTELEQKIAQINSKLAQL